jgi:electron transfer flavoprotein alpha subunit
MSGGGDRDVWVLLRAGDGGLSAADKGLLREGRRLADKLGGALAAVIPGGEIVDAETAIGAAGGDSFFPAGGGDHPERCAAVLASLVQRHLPRLFLALADAFGADVMPRLAAAAQLPLVTNCVDIEASEEIIFTKAVQGGRLHAAITAPGGGPGLATLDPHHLPEGDAPSAARRAERCEVASDGEPIDTRLDIVSRVKAAPASVDIGEAEFVVAIGSGVAAKENIATYARFAEAMGAALGGSRPAVDSGALPHARQIGQTGKSLTARLAILCGISGSDYFTAGIQKVGTKIAVNTDRDAPIFKSADLAIVADADELIPRLTERLARRAKEGGA